MDTLPLINEWSYMNNTLYLNREQFERLKPLFTSLYCRLSLLLFLFGTTWQMILRIPCGDIFADFAIFIKDKALNGSVIATISNTSDVQCMVNCVEHHKCRSYNSKIDEKKCELNSKAIGDKDTVLISKPGWVYKSTDYNATRVS